PVQFSHGLDDKVFLLKLTPGMGPGLLGEIFRLYDCVIVESFGAGGLPQSLMEGFARCLGRYEETRKVLILTTQVTYEGSDAGIYEVGRRVKDRFDFLEAHDMTIEAAVTRACGSCPSPAPALRSCSAGSTSGSTSTPFFTERGRGGCHPVRRSGIRSTPCRRCMGMTTTRLSCSARCTCSGWGCAPFCAPGARSCSAAWGRRAGSRCSVC